MDELQRRTRTYFAAQAGGYDEASRRWPWSHLRRMEAAAVMAALGDVRGKTLLELGCGAGFYTRLLLAAGAEKIFAVDFLLEMARCLPRAGAAPVVADAAAVRLQRSFTHLLCAGMLEFVPEAEPVLRNAALHAAPSARLVILVPRNNLLGRLYRWFHRRHGVEIHLFTRQDIQDAVRETGWSIIAVREVPLFSFVATLQKT